MIQKSHKKHTKTLAQQLYWQLIIVVLCFGSAITICFTFIMMQAVELTDSNMFKVAANKVLLDIEENPEKDLPREKYLQVYVNWNSVPNILRAPFYEANLDANKVYEVESVNVNNEEIYLVILLLYNSKGEKVYFFGEYDVNETDEVFDDVLSNFILDIFWLMLLIFSALLGFVFWLLKRTNAPMKLLSDWAQELKANDRLGQEEFPIEELNNIAKQLKSGVDRITDFNLREQQFLKYSSHEMRTPLAIIQACLDTLDFQLTGPAQKTVKRALKASHNMNRLSTALLWLLRSSDSKSNKSTFDTELFFRNQIDEHKYLINDRNIEFELIVNSQQLHIEKNLLSIIVSNLLRNACQHAEEGVITIEVDFDSLTICNLIGNRTIEQPSMYDSFGLGLELVKRICKKLSWRFTYEENRGEVIVMINWSCN